MRMVERIERKLGEGLAPTRIDVIDESHKHAGHAGARPEGESHFRVEVVSEQFAGKNRLERQRMVYALLSEEMAGGIHALQLKTLAPAEDAGI